MLGQEEIRKAVNGAGDEVVKIEQWTQLSFDAVPYCLFLCMAREGKVWCSGVRLTVHIECVEICQRFALTFCRWTKAVNERCKILLMSDESSVAQVMNSRPSGSISISHHWKDTEEDIGTTQPMSM